jgi:hypothetical protein
MFGRCLLLLGVWYNVIQLDPEEVKVSWKLFWITFVIMYFGFPPGPPLLCWWGVKLVRNHLELRNYRRNR